MTEQPITHMESSEQGIYRQILSLSWPILAEMGTQTLILNLNVFMISRLGDKAVASVGNVNAIFGLAGMVLSIIGFGATILISQYFGAGDGRTTTALTLEALRFNVLLATVLAALVWLVPSLFLHAVNTPPSIWQQTRHYLRLASLAVIFQIFNAVGASVLRSLGKTRIVLFFTFFVLVTTLFGNATVVYGWLHLLDLGLTGIALSNVIGSLIGSFLTGWYIHKSLPVRIQFKQLWLQWGNTRRIVAVGIPSALELGSYQATQFIIASMISLLGALEVSTRVYASAVESVSFLAGLGIAQGISILVGHRVGRSGYQQARSIVVSGARLGVVLMSLVAVLLFIFGKDIISLFTTNAQVIQWSSNVLKIIAFAQPAKALNMIVGGGLRGAGDNRWLMWISGLFVWLSVIFAYIFGFPLRMGLYGIWLGMTVDEWVRAVLVLRRLLGDHWQGKSYVA